MKLKNFFHKKTNNPNQEKLGLIAAIAAFLTLTLPTLASASIWFDEAFSAYLVRYDFAKIWHFTSVDVHPPLYYFALKVWTMLFGASDFALRSMSVFFGVLTLIVAFYLIKRIFKSTKTAVISTMFLAISPMFVRYAQEVRMYMMVAFLAVVTVRAYYEIYHAKNSAKAKKHWRIVFVLSAAAGIWTQYLSGLTIVALWLWRAFTMRKSFKKAKKWEFVKHFFSEKFFALNAWVVGLFLPWIPFFVVQAISVKSAFWIQDLSFNTLPNYISNFFTYVNSGDLNGWWSLLLFVLVGALGLALAKNKLFSKEERADFNFILAMAGLPAVILFLLSMPPAKSIFIDRYTLSGMIFIALAIGILAVKLWPKDRKLAMILAILTVIAFSYGNFEINHQRGFSKSSNETIQTRQMISRIKELAKSGEPIITTAGYFYYEMAQYSTPENPTFFKDLEDYKVGSLKMLEEAEAEKITDLAKFSQKYKTIWVLHGWGETEKAPLQNNWKLEFQEVHKDPLSGRNRYLIQKFSVQE